MRNETTPYGLYFALCECSKIIARLKWLKFGVNLQRQGIVPPDRRNADRSHKKMPHVYNKGVDR